MKKIAVFAVIFLATSGFSRAKKEAAEPIKLLNMTPPPPPPPPPPLIEWRTDDLELQLTTTATRMIVAGFLSMAAASISSAGGIGGGGLFIPILTIVAGLDLKAASSFSALMVTGGSIANVVSNVLATKKKKNTSLIDYDVALLSEPCMLLGASIGVFCNIIFPEWLITMIFTIFLVWSTFKTFKFGITHWNLESQGINIRCHHHKYLQQQQEEEDGRLGITNDIIIINPIINTVESDGNLSSRDQPLLLQEQEELLEYKVVQVVPWRKLGMLAIIWFSFFLLYLLRGGRYGHGIIPIESCGVVYWIITAAQIPLAIISTSWILFKRESICNHHQEVVGDTKKQRPDKLIFPVMAFLAGVLGGVFGIGGGMLISPFLLQLGIAPGVTAATCSFMVLFSSTMSAFQYILLGMDHIEAAIVFAVACFAGSVIGLVIVRRAIEKYGRASLIVFSVGLVLALSTVLMTGFGAVDVWHDFRNGKYMGFKRPC